MQIPTLIDNINGNTLRKTLETLLLQSVSLDILIPLKSLIQQIQEHPAD